jgi:mannose-6-phosphate isomerase-like protein (cupin superfamily)
MRAGEPGQSLSAPDGLGMTLVMTPGASGGTRLEMEWRVPPGRRLVAADHYHPDGPEVWRILEGTAGYRLDGVEREAAAPFEYEVPGSTSHGHPWNAGADPLVVRQIIAGDQPMPGLTGGVQGYFETYFAFAQRGEVNEAGDIGGRIQNVLTLHDLLVPGTFLAGPPRWAQRAVLGTLAALARATGKRPYAAPEFDRDGVPLG